MTAFQIADVTRQVVGDFNLSVSYDRLAVLAKIRGVFLYNGLKK